VKIVIDTNVFVSSFLNPKGTPQQIIDLWKSGQVTLCLCAEILSEYLEVLSRFGLAGEPELREYEEVPILSPYEFMTRRRNR
jgi:putative PIN family toxin of toxin-antitoxin system